jgi:enoyl-CoA hydratase/carnithine racemase
MDDPPVLLRYEGAIAVLTLNRPQRINALGMAMRTELYNRLLEVEANDTCRAIVLTGAGGNFCSGGDITEMKRREVIAGRLRAELPTRIFKLLITGPKPFLTAVEGNAAGCGLSFVAASDYSVAAEDAKFSCAFVKVGLMPDVGGIWTLPRKLGYRKAFEMAAFAESYTAQQALESQLINRVCKPGRTLDGALEAAERMARHPPVALALLRCALNSGNDTVDQAIATEINFMSLLMNTEDFAEAAAAFAQKRKPVFKGR